MRSEQSVFKLAKLADLVDINIGKTPARKEGSFWKGSHTWLSIADMKGDKFIEVSKEKITDEGIKKSGIKIVPERTLLFSFKLSIGKVAITNKALFTNEAIASFPINDDSIIDQNYLYYVLRELDFTGGGDRAVMGKTLNKAKLKELQIPLPPLEEQKKIAAILDAADGLRQKDAQLIAKYNALSQSLFLDMFGDPVTNPMGWSQDLMANVCTKVTDGTHDTPQRLNSGVKFITGKHIKPFFIDFMNSDYVSDVVHEEIYRRCNPSLGDVLYTNIGVNLGTAALNTVTYEFSMKNVALLKPDAAILTGTFLEYFLNHQNMKRNIIRLSSLGGAQKFLSLSQLRKLNVIHPPITLQNQFAEHIQAIEAQKQQAQASLQKSEDLFNSLLQRAFKGELT
jgi:type I restriction enzyme S subunit